MAPDAAELDRRTCSRRRNHLSITGLLAALRVRCIAGRANAWCEFGNDGIAGADAVRLSGHGEACHNGVGTLPPPEPAAPGGRPPSLVRRGPGFNRAGGAERPSSRAPDRPPPGTHNRPRPPPTRFVAQPVQRESREPGLPLLHGAPAETPAARQLPYYCALRCSPARSAPAVPGPGRHGRHGRCWPAAGRRRSRGGGRQHQGSSLVSPISPVGRQITLAPARPRPDTKHDSRGDKETQDPDTRPSLRGRR